MYARICSFVIQMNFFRGCWISITWVEGKYSIETMVSIHLWTVRFWKRNEGGKLWRNEPTDSDDFFQSLRGWIACYYYYRYCYYLFIFAFLYLIYSQVLYFGWLFGFVFRSFVVNCRILDYSGASERTLNLVGFCRGNVNCCRMST